MLLWFMMLCTIPACLLLRIVSAWEITGDGVLNCAATVVSVFIALLAAIYFGDRAGQELAKRHEEEKAARGRKETLRAFRAQLEALPRISLHNQTAMESEHVPPIPYPVIFFETAIFSADGISVRDETLKATIDYLLKAKELNAAIGTLDTAYFRYLVHPARLPHFEQQRFRTIRKFIHDQSKNDMPNIIKALRKHIDNEPD